MGYFGLTMQIVSGGFLINLEGGEGSGKSSHIPYLVNYLREKGFRVFPTREPGGTSIGEQIREVIHSLEDGEIVICDRFFDSTIAYQGFGYNQDITRINWLVDYATTGVTPDLTILLDVDVEVGRSRKKQSEEWNRMDAQDIEFHNRVRSGYLKMASVDARWIVVNANNGIEEVQADLIKETTKRLSLIGLIENERKGIER